MATQTPTLGVVRQRRTGAVLFFKKRHLPFKNDPPLEFPSYLPDQNNPQFKSLSAAKVEENIKNLRLTYFAAANNKLTETTEHVAATEFRSANKCVSFDFGNDYGFWEVYKILEKKIPPNCPYKNSKLFGEVSPHSLAMIKDAKSLTDDVFNLSSQQDMIDEFLKSSLF